MIEFCLHGVILTTLDSWNADWGVNLALPYIDRNHGTNGFAFDGSDAGTSRSKSIGDIKLVGRYLGLTEARNIGVQFGVKLATGSFTQNFIGGPLAGEALDRGLQPGSGSTDAILGAFHSASLAPNWDYFAQATAQIPLNSRADYKPGKSLNVNVGLRYAGLDSVVPQLQLNSRISGKDSGSNAATADSGGRTIYLSPGLTVPVTEKMKVYGFVQIPVYQNLNGYQLTPRATFSLGTRLDF